MAATMMAVRVENPTLLERRLLAIRIGTSLSTETPSCVGEMKVRVGAADCFAASNITGGTENSHYCRAQDMSRKFLAGCGLTVRVASVHH
jgi:hypothetical protein